SAPCPVPIELHAFEFRAGSSAVPYWQSGPGSLVSTSSVSSWPPVCGFEVLITPKPQSNWLVFVQKLRTPGPIRIAGSTKPGLWQHTSPNGQFTFVLVDVHAGSVPPPQLSHPPWMSAHLPIAPHWMHTVCSHVGGLPAVTVKVVVAVGGAVVVVVLTGAVVVVVLAGAVVVVVLAGAVVVVVLAGAVVVVVLAGAVVVVPAGAVVVVVVAGAVVVVAVGAIVVVVVVVAGAAVVVVVAGR